MSKLIVTKDELQDPKRSGMKKVAAIVKRTLGPGGLPIVIQRQGQTLEGTPLGPKITKDGVSVAEECSSPIEEEDIIIQAVKGICRKTVNAAGDGTTTAIVLGESIVKAIDEELTADSDLNPQLVKESVEAASKEVIKKLKKLATPVKSTKVIKQVATISANGDEEIGQIIADAFEHVGVDGVVTVDEGTSNRVTLDKVDGYQFNRGAEGRNAFFNNKENTQFEASDASLVIYDGRLISFNQIIPALRILNGVQNGPMGEQATKKAPPLVIIANEFSPEVLQFLLIQKDQGGMVVVPVLGPNTTSVRSGYYDDLAAYSGGTRLGNGARNLESIEEDDFGIVSRVIINKYKTTFYEGQGAEDDILARVNQLRAAKEEAESPYDAQILNDRIAALTNGIAKIGVGGATEFEIKEKYDRIEDALNAARAAIQEGVVAGGGSTLLRIARGLDEKKSIGHKILQRALQAPFYQILENIGLKEDVIAGLASEMTRSDKIVYDARNKQVKRALAAGIIDPVKVTRTALENAVSIASLLSTAGGAIIYKNNK